MGFRLDTYLDRIGRADVPPGVAGLAAVQAAHMRAIPFENVDPLLGRVPSRALEDVATKLITQRRGGYCFEHNALFGAALTALGYRTRSVLARVRTGGGQGGARSHHAFVVGAEGARWLCDTGFGGHGALQPLRLDTGGAQAAPNGRYRVRDAAAAGETMVERRAGADWVALYGFDAAPVHDIDCAAANFLCARWEGAPFSANLMVAFHGQRGRVTLFNRAVTRGLPPGTETALLGSAGELGRVLAEECGLAFDADTLARIWAKIERAPTRR